MWINLSEWARTLKIFVFPVNATQCVLTAEKIHNNQANKVTCSVGVSQPFSPATQVIAH